MARTRLEMPSGFLFTCIIPVRITDLNYGGHVGNDTLLSIIHEARMQFLQKDGYTEMNFGGTGLIMSDVTIEFKAELFYGDRVNVSISPANLSRVGFDLFYRLTLNQGEITKPVAFARTGMICYDYSNRKIVSIPEEVVKKWS